MNDFLKNMLGGALRGVVSTTIDSLGLTKEEVSELFQVAMEEADSINGLISDTTLEGAFGAAVSKRLRGAPKRAALLKLAAFAIRAAREVKV